MSHWHRARERASKRASERSRDLASSLSRSSRLAVQARHRCRGGGKWYPLCLPSPHPALAPRTPRGASTVPPSPPVRQPRPLRTRARLRLLITRAESASLARAEEAAVTSFRGLAVESRLQTEWRAHTYPDRRRVCTIMDGRIKNQPNSHWWKHDTEPSQNPKSEVTARARRDSFVRQIEWMWIFLFVLTYVLRVRESSVASCAGETTRRRWA